IHPFGDGNGRTARIIEYHTLVACGVPRPAAHLLSNHYNQTRRDYIQQLDRAGKTRDPLPFIDYAVRGLIEGLHDQAAKIREQQLELAWRSYVYGIFAGLGSSPTTSRRRDLVLALAATKTWLTPVAIRMINPKIADAYGGKTMKTLVRDLNAL